MSTKFVFLVLPEIHLMDLAGPDQTIHEAIEYGAPFEIEYCGLKKEISSSAGLSIQKQTYFEDVTLTSGDYLVIPGSNVSYILSNEFKQNKPLFAWIRKQYQRGVQLVSICAGVFVLGLADLLEGIECTTHFKRTAQLQELFPRALVKENILFTEQNGIYTSAGIASGIDLTLHIVEQRCGGYFAHKVARELVVYNRREGHQMQHSVMMQFRNHIHSGIHNTQDYIIEHIDQKMSLYDLAELACMSERNFTRVFKKETGTTVNAFINSIRRERIEQLMKNKDLSKKQIAAQVGLESERQVLRIMRGEMTT